MRLIRLGSMASMSAALLLGAWGASALAASPGVGSGAVKVKPDLTVSSARAERTGLAPDGAHRVRVTVAARCASPAPATCGAFKILAEYRDGRVGPWQRLGEAGVPSLGSGGATAVIPTATRFFDDTVPAGRTRAYRLTVDPADRVDEGNETNNTATTVYRATGCPGTDLVLTQVGMRRRADGGTLVQVWVRNRCLEPCVAEIDYEIDEGEAIPGGGGISQRIGRRIEGEAAVGPLGNAVAAGQAGRDATYTVRIVPRGGSCAETSAANNSCRVTIRAGEASRNVSCNGGP